MEWRKIAEVNWCPRKVSHRQLQEEEEEVKEVEEEVVKEEEVDGNHWVASNKLTHHCND